MAQEVTPEQFAEQRAARRRGWKKKIGNFRETKEMRKRERPGAGRGTAHSNAGHKGGESHKRSSD